MNRVFGHIEEFALVRQDRSSTIVGWDYKEVGDGINATWNETIIYKKQVWNPRFKEIKDAVIADIDRNTDLRILSGWIWNKKPVWLSAENQRNFSEGQRMAEKDQSVLPLTYKIGQYEDESPVYHTFNTFEELDGFYKQAFGYINQCLQDGWQIKDSIDWEPYQALYLKPEEPVTE